jgi:hypothetical protein
MPLSGIRLGDVTEPQLRALIDNNVSEGRRIEFKRDLGKKDEDKREFLADVSSFANAAGGDLLIGVEADTDIASELVGLPNKQADGEILRLENLIRDGIDPRIPGVPWPPFATGAPLGCEDARGSSDRSACEGRRRRRQSLSRRPESWPPLPQLA